MYIFKLYPYLGEYLTFLISTHGHRQQKGGKIHLQQQTVAILDAPCFGTRSFKKTVLSMLLHGTIWELCKRSRLLYRNQVRSVANCYQRNYPIRVLDGLSQTTFWGGHLFSRDKKTADYGRAWQFELFKTPFKCLGREYMYEPNRQNAQKALTARTRLGQPAPAPPQLCCPMHARAGWVLYWYQSIVVALQNVRLYE